MTRIKVVLLAYFIVTKRKKKRDFDLQLLPDWERRPLSLKPWCRPIQVWNDFDGWYLSILNEFRVHTDSFPRPLLSPFKQSCSTSTVSRPAPQHSIQNCLRSCISVRMWISALRVAHQWIMAHCFPKDTTDLLNRWKITSTSKKSS